MDEIAFHKPVLLRETVEQMLVRPGGVYVDATVGEGGHAGAVLLASAPDGVVLGIDWDPRSLAYARQRLAGHGQRFMAIQGNYADMVRLTRSVGIQQVDAVLLDLGFSSRQVEGEGYGFSFQKDEPLDMRYDPAGQTLTAAQMVNSYSQEELARVFFQYGEEPRSRAIARNIVQRRPINTTRELAELVAGVVRPRRGQHISGNPGVPGPAHCGE
jgi:16S rRNA (cytosine1402-N4)-methyltransferase